MTFRLFYGWFALLSGESRSGESDLIDFVFQMVRMIHFLRLLGF